VIRFLFLSVSLIEFFIIPVRAQTSTRDFKCFDKGGYRSFDLIKTTRTYGDYTVDEEWSELLTDSKIFKKNIELEGGRMYAILLATREGIDATALEIHDSEGTKLEYTFKISDLDNNQITFFYTPDRDDVYQLFFRVINSHNETTCTYMAVLEGELDPYYEEKEEE
jgi:hypothetical protein